jgi:hypothetical protein
MAEVRLVELSKLDALDLCRENFASWAWAESGVPPKNNTEAVSGLRYEEFRKFLCQLKKKRKPQKDGSDKEGDGIGGLFRIRWSPEAPHFSSRTGVVVVAYGFRASNASLLSVTSYPDDILYIGKARDVWARVARMFSTQQSSNSVARKIAALIDEITREEAHKRKEEKKDIIEKSELKKILPHVIFDFVSEEHPVKRDFMKTYAVCNEKPCINIGLEH